MAGRRSPLVIAAGRKYSSFTSCSPTRFTVTWTLLDEVPDKEKMLAVKKTDQDFRDHPEKYKNNTFSVGQILVLGDLLDADGKPIL